MLILAYRKLVRNGWLTLCLCGGLIVAVALVTSIPMYTEGALQRVLRQDSIDYRNDRNRYPGGFIVTSNVNSAHDSLEAFKQLPVYESEIERRLLADIPLPLVASTSRLDLKSMFVSDPRRENENIYLQIAKVSALPGIEQHIELIAGRPASDLVRDGVYEVVVHEEAMKEMNFLLGNTYEILDLQLNEVCRVLVRGVFRLDTSSRAFWNNNQGNLDNTFFIRSDQFMDILSPQVSSWAVDATWYFGFDTSRIATSECELLKKNLEKQSGFLASFGASAEIPLVNIIEGYLEKRGNLTTLLMFLITPVFIIAAYFLFMLVELIMESEANDIALLKSRGSPSGQIGILYFIMFSIPGLLAFVTGPFVGWGIAHILGAADGFLQFRNTDGFSSPINPRIWLFASIAVLLCFATILLPIVRSSRTTIVLHKGKIGRSSRSWMWRGLVPASGLVLVALYALYSYRMRQQILVITSVQGIDLPLDPLYFVAASLFIFGTGMIVLRLLPLTISLLFRLFSKVLPVVLYTSLIQVGRSFTRERYAFMFLLLTVASGIFYSSAARSLNLSTEHRILYENGSDIRLVPISRTSSGGSGTARSDTPTNAGDGFSAAAQGPSSDSSFIKFMNQKRRLSQIYPSLAEVRSLGGGGSRDIDDYERIEGVESATLVARVPEAVLVAPNGRREDITVLGIDPESFGKTSWYRSDLNQYTLTSYLQALARYPDHVFVSSSILDRYQYDLRKPFSVQISGAGSFNVYVLDSLSFWPSMNPFILNADERGLVICSLQYLDAMMLLEKTEVWLRRDQRVDDIAFYTSLLENGFDFTELDDSGEEIRTVTTAPQFAGFNGALTLSYIVTVAISLLGFVVCWVVSLHERQLQFGVFRSLGMTSRSVVGILFWEQLLISGSAIIAGCAIGSLVSQLFLPILGITASASDQVPPLQIGAYKSDYYTIVSIVVVMLLFAFIFLGLFVSRMKVHQALKLGED